VAPAIARERPHLDQDSRFDKRAVRRPPPRQGEFNRV
jgi:hypothetical protein